MLDGVKIEDWVENIFLDTRVVELAYPRCSRRDKSCDKHGTDRSYTEKGELIRGEVVGRRPVAVHKLTSDVDRRLCIDSDHRSQVCVKSIYRCSGGR